MDSIDFKKEALAFVAKNKVVPPQLEVVEAAMKEGAALMAEKVSEKIISLRLELEAKQLKNISP